jgi:hypothetical protein
MADDKTDPLVAELLGKYDLPDDAVWRLVRKNKSGPPTVMWIMYHRWVERVVALAGITFDPPVMIEYSLANRSAAMLVTARMGERVEWSIGEAAPYNIGKITYPFAMAEKRAKDRAALKLLDVHGVIYSENEGDFEKQRPREVEDDGSGFAPPINPDTRSAYSMKKDNPDAWDEAMGEIRDARTIVELTAVAKAISKRFEAQNWPEGWRPEIKAEIEAAREAIIDMEEVQDLALETGE